MVKPNIHGNADSILIKWKIDDTDYKAGEILILIFVSIFYILTIATLFGHFPFFLLIFVPPVSRLNVDWKQSLPIFGEIADAIKSFEWNSSSSFALIVVLFIAAFEISFLVFLIYLI